MCYFEQFKQKAYFGIVVWKTATNHVINRISMNRLCRTHYQHSCRTINSTACKCIQTPRFVVGPIKWIWSNQTTKWKAIWFESNLTPFPVGLADTTALARPWSSTSASLLYRHLLAGRRRRSNRKCSESKQRKKKRIGERERERPKTNKMRLTWRDKRSPAKVTFQR